MSVINKVLNDIEQREKSQQEQAAKKLDYLEVTEPKSRYVRLVIAVVILCLIVIIWWQWNALSSANSVVDNTSVTVAHIEPIVPERVSAKAEIVKAIEVISVTEVAETKIIATEAKNNSVSHGTQESEELAVEQKVVAQQIVPPPTIQPLTTMAVKKPIVEPKKQASLSITPVKLSGDELAKLKYQQGLKQQRQGKIEQAQQSWRAAIKAKADYHSARESLAASFYGANDAKQALAILDLGQRAYPRYQGFRVMMAQILFKQQRPKLALEKLNQPFNDRDASDEALALAGSIAQSLSLWSQVQQNYQVLHQRQPFNAKWLVSLAISLDGQNKFELAHQKYQQFLRLPNLDKALSRYANERIIQLKLNIETRENNG